MTVGMVEGEAGAGAMVEEEEEDWGGWLQLERLVDWSPMIGRELLVSNNKGNNNCKYAIRNFTLIIPHS